MEITFEQEADAQNFAGRLIWDEIPFKVHYAQDSVDVIFTLNDAQIPEYVKLYQGKYDAK